MPSVTDHQRSYVEELARFRDDPTVWSSAFDYLGKRLDQEGEDNLFGALLTHPEQPQEFRQRMMDVADELYLDMRSNVAFRSGASCSVDAIWRMPVVLAEHLGALNGDWEMLSRRPVKSEPQCPHFVAVVVDKHTGTPISLMPAGRHRF